MLAALPELPLRSVLARLTHRDVAALCCADKAHLEAVKLCVHRRLPMTRLIGVDRHVIACEGDALLVWVGNRLLWQRPAAADVCLLTLPATAGGTVLAAHTGVAGCVTHEGGAVLAFLDGDVLVAWECVLGQQPALLLRVEGVTSVGDGFYTQLERVRVLFECTIVAQYKSVRSNGQPWVWRRTYRFRGVAAGFSDRNLRLSTMPTCLLATNRLMVHNGEGGRLMLRWMSSRGTITGSAAVAHPSTPLTWCSFGDTVTWISREGVFVMSAPPTALRRLNRLSNRISDMHDVYASAASELLLLVFEQNRLYVWDTRADAMAAPSISIPRHAYNRIKLHRGGAITLSSGNASFTITATALASAATEPMLRVGSSQIRRGEPVMIREARGCSLAWHIRTLKDRMLLRALVLPPNGFGRPERHTVHRERVLRRWELRSVVAKMWFVADASFVGDVPASFMFVVPADQPMLPRVCRLVWEKSNGKLRVRRVRMFDDLQGLVDVTDNMTPAQAGARVGVRQVNEVMVFVE